MSEITAESSPKQSFNGGCHCGFIKYTAQLPAIGTAGRCNCTVCQKSGYLSFRLKDDEFTLVSPASVEEILDYQYRSKDLHLHFCGKCGVTVFRRGFFIVPSTKEKVNILSLNLVTVDQPQGDLDLSKWNYVYADGLNDNWMAGTKDEPWPHGSR